MHQKQLFPMIHKYVQEMLNGYVAKEEITTDKIKDYILGGEIKAAIAYCRSVDTPSARMIEKGISRLGRPVNDVQAAIENVGNIEVAKLEKGLTIMATISGGAPMIGFLGTVTGMVRARPDSQVNKDMATGAVEVFAHGLEIINRSEPLPLDFNQTNTEEQRLRYRYLDLRRPEMAASLKTRAKITSFVRRDRKSVV